MYIWVPAWVYVPFMNSVACRGQKMVLDHLELVIGDCEPSCGCWEPNQSPL